MIVLPTLAGIAVLGVAGMVTVRRFLAPPQTPPAYTGPRPEPAEDGYLSHPRVDPDRCPDRHVPSVGEPHGAE